MQFYVDDWKSVSIHAPLARSNCGSRFLKSCSLFQYMLLLRGATTVEKYFELVPEAFQYMLLLRGATGE